MPALAGEHKYLAEENTCSVSECLPLTAIYKDPHSSLGRDPYDIAALAPFVHIAPVGAGPGDQRGWVKGKVCDRDGLVAASTVVVVATGPGLETVVLDLDSGCTHWAYCRRAAQDIHHRIAVEEVVAIAGHLAFRALESS